MRSVKPGRGPSAMGAVTSLVCVMFGIGWTIMTYNGMRDFPFPFAIMFPLFGVAFVIVGLVQTYYHFTNATGRNRFSAFDITNANEEPDPLDQAYGRERQEAPVASAGARRVDGEFCPYCGAKVQQDFDYCPKCGKDI